MLKIIDVDAFIKKYKLNGPITTPQYFLGKSKTSYHPKGLFSEEIFGLEGSPDRSRSLSWIELNCRVIHPVIFEQLSKRRIETRIVDIVSLEKSYSLDKNGYIVNPPPGEEGELYGMLSLEKNIHRINLRRSDNPERDRLIDRIGSFISQGLFFIDKLLVIAPAFRPITVHPETGELFIDPLNEIYRRVINLSTQIKGAEESLYNALAYRMQMLLQEIHDYIRTTVSKKHGIIRELMLGTRVDFSARAVITPNPDIDLGTIGLPLRIVVGIFEPFMIYGAFNSPYADKIPEEFHRAAKDFLASHQ